MIRLDYTSKTSWQEEEDMKAPLKQRYSSLSDRQSMWKPNCHVYDVGLHVYPCGIPREACQDCAQHHPLIQQNPLWFCLHFSLFLFRFLPLPQTAIELNIFFLKRHERHSYCWCFVFPNLFMQIMQD